MNLYSCLEDIIVDTAASVRPPERLSVSEAAVKYRKLNNPGGYVGDWNNRRTSYLIEPMDLLSSTAFTGMIFVGPAQCGKTEIWLNWQTYSVICDPNDMMLIQTSQTTARDFSKRRIDRLHRHTPEVGERLIVKRNADNTFDKNYKSGMMLSLSWPTINELSGKPIPRLFLTDYDRMTQNVDGEGNPFDLARKRATTFGRNGMTVAESSPGFIVDNPRWIQSSPHEAPPTQGILSLFNRGDRRKFYWRCISCQHAFEPRFSLLNYPKTSDHMDAAEQAVMPCPQCGQVYTHNGDHKLGTPGKDALNRSARWIKDGQIWTPEGSITGQARRSDIASFWLKGAAAAFTDWKTLVLNYLKAEEEYEKTGSQEALKTTVNVDQGEAYIMRGANEGRLPEDLKNRAIDLGVRTVPSGVRFLVATIDVQKRRFVVQVHGVGQGGDIYVIDRFDIHRSKRRDPEDLTQFLGLDPGAYLEDWKILVDAVIQKAYPLGDDTGRSMSIKKTLCDSGGSEGVTSSAYNFWRWLRDGDEKPDKSWVPNLHRRFQLIKGDPNLNSPRIRISYPDSERKDRHADARGEVPVLFINSTLMKDMADSRLNRETPHGGRVNFASWLPDNFYTELTVEVRTTERWENPKKFRNESWDLLVYCLAACLMKDINIELAGFWEEPPTWAEEWDLNDLVFNPETEDKPFAVEAKAKYDLAQIGNQLA